MILQRGLFVVVSDQFFLCSKQRLSLCIYALCYSLELWYAFNFSSGDIYKHIVFLNGTIKLHILFKGASQGRTALFVCMLSFLSLI